MTTVSAVIDALDRAPKIVVPLVREVPPSGAQAAACPTAEDGEYSHYSLFISFVMWRCMTSFMRTGSRSCC